MTLKNRAVYTIIIFIFLLIRLINLGYDLSNSDAARWHRRSERFLEALKKGDFKSTYQHYQPGVTLMWINALTKETAFKYQLFYTDTPKTLENADWYPQIHGFSKAVIVGVLALLLLYQMSAISRIFSAKTSLIYGFLMTVEPYLIGIDRWFHLTSLETYFGFSSLLALLTWKKVNKNSFLYLSAVFLALSVLSKLTSLVLLPFLLVLLFTYSRDVKKLGIFTATFAAVFILVFPAMWTQPLWILQKLMQAAGNAVANDIRASEISPFVSLVFYPLMLIYKLSPITLLGGLISLISTARTFKQYSPKIAVAGFFVFYLIVLTVPQKKIDRYSLVLLPPLILLVSSQLAEWKNKYIAGTIPLSLIFIFYVIYTYHPVYSAYYSPLFGATNTALKIGIYDNSGEYFAQAAFYLNGRGRDQFTYIPDNIESFSYFYKGNLQRTFDTNTNYIVRSYDIDRSEIKEPNCTSPEKTFGSKEHAVVFVFKCRQ